MLEYSIKYFDGVLYESFRRCFSIKNKKINKIELLKQEEKVLDFGIILKIYVIVTMQI